MHIKRAFEIISSWPDLPHGTFIGGPSEYTALAVLSGHLGGCSIQADLKSVVQQGMKMFLAGEISNEDIQATRRRVNIEKDEPDFGPKLN